MKTYTPVYAVAAVLAIAALVFAQPPVAPSENAGATKSSAAGVRQEHVQRMMQDLEQKFVDLARSLEKTEPGQAKRLIDALQKSKESGIQNRMSQITQSLNQADFTTASSSQKEVVAELEALIAILLAEDDALRDEYQRLERWREQLNQLLNEELQQLRDTEDFSQSDQVLASLAEKIAQVEDLIQKQKALTDQTIQARQKGVHELDKLSSPQGDLRAETEKLARSLDPAADTAADTNGAKDQDPADSESEPDSAENPGTEPPADSAETEQGETPDTKTPAPSSNEEADAPSSQSPGNSSGQPSGGGSSSSEPGQQSLESASTHQRQAESDLNAGRGRQAEQNQRKALEELEKALEQLKAQQRRVVSLPEEALNEIAKQQDSTSKKAAQLAQEMQDAPPPSSSDPSQESGDNSQPGDQQLQQAQQAMQQAAQKLREQEGSEATEEQKQAAEALKKAMAEVEERLAQLRKEMQMEKLAALEQRFQEMLDRQKPISESTRTLQSLRDQNKFSRADRLRVAKLGDEERAIADQAQIALEIIVEDGTSVVFPSVVQQLVQDLQGTSELLKQLRSDSYTQSQQAEIETTLQELIDALRQLQEQMNQQGSDGGEQSGSGDENAPLLPGSAELKLLKASQLRVNRRTKAFEEIRPKQGELESVLESEILGISQRQAEIAELTQEMIDRQH